MKKLFVLFVSFFLVLGLFSVYVLAIGDNGNGKFEEKCINKSEVGICPEGFECSCVTSAVAAGTPPLVICTYKGGCPEGLECECFTEESKNDEIENEDKLEESEEESDENESDDEEAEDEEEFEQEIKIKRKFVDSQGNERIIEIEIEVEIEDGVVERKIKIKYEIKGEFEIKTKLEIKERISNETNDSLIDVILSNGTEQKIKLMPDRASEIAIERLKAKNFTIELKEIEHKNIPRVVYNIETNKHGRFLGVFKFSMKVEGQIDPVTGEFIGVSKPWWAFLVTGEDEPEIEPPQNETGNVTIPGNETLPGNETMPENETGNLTNSS